MSSFWTLFFYLVSVGKNKKFRVGSGEPPYEQVPEYRSQVMIALQLLQVSAYFTYLFHDTVWIWEDFKTLQLQKKKKKDSRAFKFCLLLLSSKGKHAVLLFAFLNPSSFSKSWCEIIHGKRRSNSGPLHRKWYFNIFVFSVFLTRLHNLISLLPKIFQSHLH